jgi:hypothetical protein
MRTKRFARGLALGVCLTVVATPALAARKSTKAKAKKVTKAPTSSRGDSITEELGVFTGSPEAVRDTLVSRWGFPAWWPAVAGRIAYVNVGWSTDYVQFNGPLERQFTVDVLVDPPVSAQLLADKISFPAEFVRQPLKPDAGGASTGVLVSDAIEYRTNLSNPSPLLKLSVSRVAVINGKHLVNLTFREPIGSGSEVRVPSPALLKLVQLPAGGVWTRADFNALDHTIEQQEDLSFRYKTTEPRVQFSIDFSGSTGDPVSVAKANLPSGFSAVENYGATIARNALGTSLTLSVYKAGTGSASVIRDFAPGSLFPKV